MDGGGCGVRFFPSRQVRTAIAKVRTHDILPSTYTNRIACGDPSHVIRVLIPIAAIICFSIKYL